jgi:hypothetical protein
MQGTREVVARLRDDGFAVTPSYVRFLLAESWLPSPPRGPGGCLCWSEGDTARLRVALCLRQRGPGVAR